MKSICSIAIPVLLAAASAVPAADKVDFEKQIRPILELNCVACHREGYAKGKYRMDIKSGAFKGGSESGPGITPGKLKESSVYTSITAPIDDDALMPPRKKNGPLPKESIALITAWIEQGAPWPDAVILVPRKLDQATGDEDEIVADIHRLITSRTGPATAAEMKRYTNTIPGTEVQFVMVPIPAGEFLMGSPENEPGRATDEGPRRKVKISPFWMEQCEVTWNEFELFMYQDEERKYKTTIPTDPAVDKVSDAVTRPTKPYVEMSFGMGKDNFPAISMTQHAANKYCQWLSAKMGHFYRLPTAAEWEYACRAGTTSAYSFGDDASKIGEYAWYEKNSDFKYQKVGKKKPNPWSLFDMHGNVAEWCLDQYETNYVHTITLGEQDPWHRVTKNYPHTVRGGSWDDEPPKLRSAAQRGSSKAWKIQDPQLPKSIWYHTDAQFLGFRIVRPLKTPSAEEMQKYWNNGVEKD